MIFDALSPLSPAVWTGLEPATPCVTGRYSNQLNYHTVFKGSLGLVSLKLTSLPFAFAKVKRFFELCKYFRNIFSKTFPAINFAVIAVL